MASKIVNTGLQQSAKLTNNITAGGAGSPVQSMAFDTLTGAGNAFAAAHTKLNDPAAPTVTAVAFDATFPSLAAQTVTYQGTLPAGTFNGNTIGRISLHYMAFGSVTASSVSLYGGIDQQSILKNADFSLVIQMTVAFTAP